MDPQIRAPQVPAAGPEGGQRWGWHRSLHPLGARIHIHTVGASSRLEPPKPARPPAGPEPRASGTCCSSHVQGERGYAHRDARDHLSPLHAAQHALNKASRPTHIED